MNQLTQIAPALAVRRAGAADVLAIDAFIATHPEATPFHRPAWLAAIERGCGAEAHMLLAEGEGVLLGILPLSHVRSHLFGSALISSGFGVGGGILAITDAAAEALADAALALAEKRGCPGIELRGGPVPAGWRRAEGVYATFARPLPAGDEAILKSIPKRQRADVRRGVAMGHEVRQGRSEADLADHFRVYSEVMRNHGTPIFPRGLFAAVVEEFGDDAEILTIVHEGRPVASFLSLFFKGCVYPYWGGGIAEARALRATETAYYELMRRAAARGCTSADFGRSKLGTGPYKFKKIWGFEPTPLVYATHGRARDTNPLSAQYRLKVALWRKLPLPFANRIGPLIARGLG
jgi:FemAB-related protein (PEP-CTERM system-associated)